MPSIVALIPARAGSKRIPGKNTRDFFGHPLIAYTIHAARESGIFSKIIVSSEDERTGFIAINYGARWHARDDEYAQDSSPDILWVRDVLSSVEAGLPDAFAILRPTSPFRTGTTIRRAWKEFQRKQPCDSLRAVERVQQHPAKMWQCGYRCGEMKPLLPAWPWPEGPIERADSPWMCPPFHSRPTQTLPEVYVQNASLEIAWSATVKNRGSISGDRVMPFFTEGYEGFDLNTEDDWARATSLVDRGLVALPALAPQTPIPAPK